MRYDFRKGLPDDHRTVSYGAGEPIFSDHDPGDCMYVVQDGYVEIRLGTGVLESVSAGGILGEMALIDDGPRSADAVAAGDCTVVPIDQSAFLSLVGETPSFALEVMRVLVRRLRDINEKL